MKTGTPENFLSFGMAGAPIVWIPPADLTFVSGQWTRVTLAWLQNSGQITAAIYLDGVQKVTGTKPFPTGVPPPPAGVPPPPAGVPPVLLPPVLAAPVPPLPPTQPPSPTPLPPGLASVHVRLEQLLGSVECGATHRNWQTQRDTQPRAHHEEF